MKLGVVYQPIAGMAPVDEVAVAAEGRGIAALYLSGDHTHIPAVRTTPFPGGHPLPDGHRRALDPLIALAPAAARTTTIRLGTCVFLLAQRDAISAAKQVATLDVLAPGRIDLGVGYGWNVEEAADHGVEWATRRARVREHVAAARALWTEEEATHLGDHVRFERAWMWPKPAPEALPRVLLGASPGPRTFRDIGDWADGWFPVPGWGHGPADVVAMRAAVAHRGRDPGEIAVVVPGEPAEPARLDPWRDVGVEAVLTPLPSAPIDDVLTVLDDVAVLLDRYSDDEENEP